MAEGCLRQRGGMMALQHPEDEIYDDINVTPMLDVAYVLLIIFIIMTTATVQGITVDLPKASAQPRSLSDFPKKVRG